MNGRFLDMGIDYKSPYHALLTLSRYDFRNAADRLLFNAIIEISRVYNVGGHYSDNLILTRCIIQMDNEPFQRLIYAISELGLNECAIAVLHIRHNAPIEKSVEKGVFHLD